MPQLDTVTYLTQYSWTLMVLIVLFSLLVNTILPRLQQQLVIREKSGQYKLDGGKSEFMRSEILIFRSLFQQDQSRPHGIV